ncbi:hypothetical protein QNH20_18510 [Neobacillus sp. WH10]|uniref:hypothetical protein n=1 Tax=Neobacillus sp. WH10 TaxID=3047873 RepID=UPI0024C125CB|nr:hypothetical protein [Neobacillus sp. WH10]WHY76105.1 hypothetical protein QNH20_18510 [Neobacillus sp. WH10]
MAIKLIKLNMSVSVPDRICFPNRRDPYQWENGVVIAIAKGKTKVRIWNSFTKKSYERWFNNTFIKKPSFYHYRGEETDFNNWVVQQASHS